MSGDTSSSAARVIRPAQVMVAATILGISIAIGCAYALHMLTRPSMIWLPAGIVLLSTGVIYAIVKRNNWARLLLLVVTVLGAAALLASLVTSPLTHENFTAYAVRGIQSALRLGAVYLLFTDPARSWFNAAARR